MKKTASYSALFIAFAAAATLIMGACFAGYEGLAEAQYQFKAAGKSYEEGRYDEAVTAYKKIIEMGFESGNVYYNLGNCYFKKGRLGEAVLSYEKARLFLPSDGDLKSNYKYTLSLLNAGPEESLAPRFLRPLEKAYKPLGIDGLAVLASALYVIICVLIVLRVFFNGIKKANYYLVPVFSLLFIFSLLALKSEITLLKNEGIVLSGGIEARFEPLDAGTVYFSLPEGSKVLVLDSRPGWHKIKRADAKIGWVKSDMIGLAGG